MTDTLHPIRESLAEVLEQLTTEQLEHILACRRARQQDEGPTYAEENRRLRDQATACRVAWTMIVVDGFPAELVAEAAVAAYPDHREAILATVAEALREVA